MPDSSRHSADLAVLSLDQFQFDPTVRHIFSETDGRNARRNARRLRIEKAGAARECPPSRDDDSARQFSQGFGRRDPFDLRPVDAAMLARGMKQFGVQGGFVAQEEEPFAVGIESSEWVNARWETEFGQGSVRGAVRGELGQHAVRLVEGKEHEKK